MTVDILYRIDDVVDFNYEKREICGFCGGSGKIAGFDGTELTCPKCQGAGYFTLIPRIETIEKGNIVNIAIDWKTGEAVPEVVYTINMINGGAMTGRVKIPQDDIIDKVN